MTLQENEVLEQAYKAFHQRLPIKVKTELLRHDTIDVPSEAGLRVMGKEFRCKIAGTLNTATLNSVVRSVREEDQECVLVTRYVDPTTQEELMRSGVNVIDCAGNFHIQYLCKGKVIFCLTNKGERNSLPKEKPSTVFKEAGIKVIFYLLQDERNVNNVYRAIKEQTGVALGTVKNVIDELVAQRFILTTDKGRFLKNRDTLAEQWAVSYCQVMKPKLFLGRMAFKNEDCKRQWQNITLPEGMCWGGECAAHLLDGYLQPATFNIYTEIPTAHLARTGAAVPDMDGEIHLYQKFWKGPGIPELVVYADLMGSGNSRVIEAAQKIIGHEYSK